MHKTSVQLIVAIMLTSASAAWATGGRLDKSGCHNSKKVGYHCHRAQPDRSAGKAKPSKAPPPANATMAPKK